MSQIQRVTAGSRRIPASSLTTTSSLNPDTFAPFGQVIQNPATHHGRPGLQKVVANQGTATVWLDITHMVNHYQLSRSKKAANTFIPLGISPGDESTRYLVIVAPTLPLQSGRKTEDLQPPYPTPEARNKRSFRERLLGARPNPFTNDFATSTTPEQVTSSVHSRPKGPGLPDLDNIKVFVAKGDQAVTYAPGTWHAPMVALGAKDIDFVVVQFANGVASEDCQEVAISASDGGDGLAVEFAEEIVGLRAKL